MAFSSVLNLLRSEPTCTVVIAGNLCSSFVSRLFIAAFAEDEPGHFAPIKRTTVLCQQPKKPVQLVKKSWPPGGQQSCQALFAVITSSEW